MVINKLLRLYRIKYDSIYYYDNTENNGIIINLELPVREKRICTCE